MVRALSPDFVAHEVCHDVECVSVSLHQTLGPPPRASVSEGFDIPTLSGNRKSYLPADVGREQPLDGAVLVEYAGDGCATIASPCSMRCRRDTHEERADRVVGSMYLLARHRVDRDRSPSGCGAIFW